MKTVLFAFSRQQAEVDYLQHLSPADRRNVIVVLRRQDEQRIRGLHEVSFCFLDGWYLDWNPRDADEVYRIWTNVYGVDRVWEITDVRRANHARGLMNLPRITTVATLCLLDEVPYVPDRWLNSDQRDRFVNLKRKPGTDALPGLDDKPGSKNPLGGIVFKEIFDIEDPSGSYPLYADWFIRTHDRDVETHRNADRARRAREEWELENERAKAFRNALIHEYVLMQLNSYEPNLSLLNGVTVD